MRVADIYDDASFYLGNSAQDVVFRALTYATKYLANKGDWDVMKGYVDLPVQNSNIVVLPWQVDTPLKFQIGGAPSFSKDRLYEFTINGFGSGARVDTSWEDRGFIPLLSIPPNNTTFYVTPSAADAGKKVILRGKDVNNNEITETLLISATVNVTSVNTYLPELIAVNKDLTTNNIQIFDTSTSTLRSTYYPNETEPKYRKIQLSVTGQTARFLFRRKVFKIYTLDDFIPIQSDLGLLTMIQSIQALRRKDMEVAKALADAAVEITTDAQRATTGFIELANNTEIQYARNYAIFNRDSIVMADIYDDAAKIFGNVGQQKLFDFTTNALEALCNKGHWDGLTGFVDILTDGRRYATLPRFVDSPIVININGRPTFMQNKWAEFHLNGPGSDEWGSQGMSGTWPGWTGAGGTGRWFQISTWANVGEVVTLRPLEIIAQLVPIPDDPTDDGKTITVFGYDEAGKWIRTNNKDGFVLTINHNKVIPSVTTDQTIAKIERIIRDPTNGFVRLYAFDQTQTVSQLLGYYYPDETEPRYFRIKLPLDALWIRLRYRKRTYKITSVFQPLHLHSKLAITTMLRALKAAETDPAVAEAFETKAVKYMDEDQRARNPGETFQIQFNEDCGWNSNFITS